MNERDEAVATEEQLLMDLAEPMDEVATDENTATEVIDGGGEDGLVEGESVDFQTSDEIGSDEGFSEESIDDYSGEEFGIDPVYDEGAYMDYEYDEGMYMDPGMEMGMGEVKDPLLSSWPFVIGISAAVLLVSIVIGALLAKLKIKKGIDLYED